MKEIFKLILLLVILSGCIENDEEIILNNSDLEDVSEYKRAEDLICQFSCLLYTSPSPRDTR